MKDELGGKVMTEFVTLRANLFIYTLFNVDNFQLLQ